MSGSVQDTMGLAEAAAQLRVPYQQAHRMVLLGQLSGKKKGSRWYVTTDSVKDLQREQLAPGLGQETLGQVNSRTGNDQVAGLRPRPHPAASKKE